MNIFSVNFESIDIWVRRRNNHAENNNIMDNIFPYLVNRCILVGKLVSPDESK